MSAGLGVMAVGAGLAVARSSVKRAAGFAKHQMLGKYVATFLNNQLMCESDDGNTIQGQIVPMVPALDVLIQVSTIPSLCCGNPLQAAR